MIKLLLVEDDSTFSYIVKNELQEIIGGYACRSSWGILLHRMFFRAEDRGEAGHHRMV